MPVRPIYFHNVGVNDNISIDVLLLTSPRGIVFSDTYAFTLMSAWATGKVNGRAA